MTTLGPMVRRSAKVGGLLLAVGAVQFVIAMAVAELLWNGSYSLSRNAISDLGGSGSAAAWLFNDSVRVLGLLDVLGIVLVYRALAPKTASKLGAGLIALAGLAAIAVGTFPEGSPQLGGNLHSLVALLAFLGSGLGLLVLSAAMLRDTRWDGYRLFTLLGGGVTLVALVLYATGRDYGLGPGGMERLVVAPILVWAIVAGAHLLRMMTYHPELPSSPPSYSVD